MKRGEDFQMEVGRTHQHDWWKKLEVEERGSRVEASSENLRFFLVRRLLRCLVGCGKKRFKRCPQRLRIFLNVARHGSGFLKTLGWSVRNKREGELTKRDRWSCLREEDAFVDENKHLGNFKPSILNKAFQPVIKIMKGFGQPMLCITLFGHVINIEHQDRGMRSASYCWPTALKTGY